MTSPPVAQAPRVPPRPQSAPSVAVAQGDAAEALRVRPDPSPPTFLRDSLWSLSDSNRFWGLIYRI